jgi:hypothetical protein
MEFEQAEADANAALRLEAPVLNPKTLLRRGTARVGLKRIAAARTDFKQVVSLEPGNRCARPPAAGTSGAACRSAAGPAPLWLSQQGASFTGLPSSPACEPQHDVCRFASLQASTGGAEAAGGYGRQRRKLPAGPQQQPGL